MSTARKLNNNHEIWYIDGYANMSKTLKEAGKAVKQFEEAGWFVLSTTVDRYEEHDCDVVYTATIIIDKSYNVPV